MMQNNKNNYNNYNHNNCNAFNPNLLPKMGRIRPTPTAPPKAGREQSTIRDGFTGEYALSADKSTVAPDIVVNFVEL